MVSIFLITGIPGYFFPHVSPLAEKISVDKLVHLFIFSVFVTTILYGSAKHYNAKVNSIFTVYAVLIGISTGAITEILQEYLFVGRSGSIWDFVADAVGCLLAILFFSKWEKKMLSL